MSATQRPLISRGERAPDFIARRGDGRQTRFYGTAGGAPSVLVFSGGGGERAATELVDRVRDVVGPDVDMHVVATGTHLADADTFHDAEGKVHGAYGVPVGGSPVTVVLDPNLRAVGSQTHGPADAHAFTGSAGYDPLSALAAAAAGAALPADGVLARRQAPVLFIPDVLDATLCGRLIELWDAAGSVQTGVEATVGTQRVESADELRKRRRDHTVSDPQWLRTLSSHVGRRVMPEIRKAFAYEASRFEGFKIGSYEATDAGFFSAHRDNLSPTTAHRRFGLTVNLSDDYDGGELRFPEYGPDRYRPAAGEALIFSGAHLHEVLPVTRGRRFVLLSFLFGADAARQ